MGPNEIAIAIAVATIGGAGMWLTLGRDLIGIVIGLALIGTATNLFLFAAGRLASSTPPLVPEGASTISTVSANPLPQALVLTAIVIGFAIACFAIALVLALARQARPGDPVDADQLRHAEPLPRADGEPERVA